MVEYDFTGETAAVTGAASGIGRETALAFARNGAAVVVADIDEAASQQVVEEIADAGGEAVAVQADVTEMDDMERMVETAVAEFGSLDHAVNNAGIGGAQQPVGELDEGEWERTIDINLTGVWRSLRAELDRMVEQDEGGTVVNMASVLGRVGFENSAEYVAAKHGVLGLTKTAAWEYAAEDIRVNAVCPGYTETELYAENIEDADLDLVDAIPRGEVATPEEIADTVTFLLSESAANVNGAVLRVDGGMLA